MSATSSNVKATAQKDKVHYLAPSPVGSACILVGTAIAFVSYPSGELASEMATISSIPVGLGFFASVVFDVLKGGLRNLLRVDLLCVAGIYALTLLEFLFPQEGFNTLSNPVETDLALKIVLPGLAAFVIGRHLIKPRRMKSKMLTLDDLSNSALFQIYALSAFLGFLYMLNSVEFQLFGEGSLVYHLQGGRFSQPWTRGALGGINSLITELALLLYVLPPLAGVIINRWRTFPILQLVFVLLVLLLTFFQGFAGGTRNVFVAYVATFLMGYFLTLKKNTILNTLIPIFLSVWFIGWASDHMLAFRNMGLRPYLEYELYNEVEVAGQEEKEDTFAVDYNLYSIGVVAKRMPTEIDYLGSELIIWSIVKPIPRAFWKGKPEGLSVSIEEIAGVYGYTLAVTYIGEAYMVAGIPGVICISLFLGALAAWWNRMGTTPQTDYALVVYALGFFAAGLTMRSFFWLTTAAMPVIALIVFRKYGPFK